MKYYDYNGFVIKLLLSLGEFNNDDDDVLGRDYFDDFGWGFYWVVLYKYGHILYKIEQS